MNQTHNDNKTFFSDDATESYIDMERYNDICWINKLFVDPDNQKLFMMLSKTSFLEMKKKGCTKYQQLVSEDDWNLFLKENNEWKILKQNNVDRSMLIECDITLAHELFMDSLLRNNNSTNQ